MSLRRIVLAVLTLIVVALSVGPALISSLEEQQIAGRLELYQTDLLLQAQEFSFDDETLDPVRQSIVGKAPLERAIEQYQSIREDAASQATGLIGNAQADPSPEPPQPQPVDAFPEGSVPQDALKGRLFINRLDLRLGILQAKAGRLEDARDRWQAIDQKAIAQSQTATDQAKTARVLAAIWSDPPQILPDAEAQIQRSLQGWFQTQALAQLYRAQQRSDTLAQLEAAAQETAKQSLIKLTLLGIGPALGGVIGVGLLISLAIQRLVQGERALLSEGKHLRWITPWNWEITWQVLIVGFFFVGQIILPIVLIFVRALVLNPLLAQASAVGAAPSGRVSAGFTLFAYLLLALSSLVVLYFSVGQHRPLPEGWFRFKLFDRWPLWGLGGYFAAVPLVIGVSLINQQIWQGRGGSNPLLEIVLDETDPVALGLFFFTAAVAAPIFEEFLFRGFLLPSLTRYMAAWPAIALSAFIFAAAHLSVSEILPLMVLGIVLGFVYTRSRNLLAPMLLHSLWNSATMLGLFVLGSVE
ncbi:MAG: lysostaphin resistance A-like protein [Elainellaceae cyanobacterium]